MSDNGATIMYCIISVDEDQPALRDLYNHVLQQGAIKWWEISTSLLDPANEHNLLKKITHNMSLGAVSVCWKCG